MSRNFGYDLIQEIQKERQARRPLRGKPKSKLILYIYIYISTIILKKKQCLVHNLPILIIFLTDKVNVMLVFF